MIKFENTEVVGLEAAIKWMRNSLDSLEKSDSSYTYIPDEIHNILYSTPKLTYCIGLNDMSLIDNLRESDTDYRKFMSMITVYVDITAPLYWWRDLDTCKIADKEFTLSDFSKEHLFEYPSLEILNKLIESLNISRACYLECKDPTTKKDWWWQIVQLLPSSYNQKRTVKLNYEVLANMYESYINHKLDELSENKESIRCRDEKEFLLCWDFPAIKGFYDWIDTLPCSELITNMDL